MTGSASAGAAMAADKTAAALSNLKLVIDLLPFIGSKQCCVPSDREIGRGLLAFPQKRSRFSDSAVMGESR
jgi:hypothetical protein